MMNILAASTSTLYGQEYLAYIEPVIQRFFEKANNILFVPYAQPGGISPDAYTAKAATVFTRLGFALRGAHEFASPAAGEAWADGFFTGGGNTFLLLRALYDTGYFDIIDKAVRAGKPYMGTSAGSNVTGLTIGTTNDMPIVYPPSFQAFGWLPFNLNPHYQDPETSSTHMGETREDRIYEFHTQNDQPVVGLREGSWLLVHDNSITLEGALTARIFQQAKTPFECSPGALQL